MIKQIKLTKEEKNAFLKIYKALPHPLTLDDFERTMNGILIKYNSHLIKPIIYLFNNLPQILENQEFVNQYKEELKKLRKISNNTISLEECDKITKQMWNNKQAAQKLEKITELEKLDESDCRWKRKLQKILKDNQK